MVKTVRKNLKTRRLSRKSRALKTRKTRARTLKTKTRTRRVLASVYVPGSDNFTSAVAKPRFVGTGSKRTLVKPRLTRKGGYTKWQVKTQTLGIGSLRKSKLTQFGYHTDLSKTERAAALSKAIKEYGALSVYRSLNALAVYNKNTHPEMAKHAKEDRDMIRAKFF
jgi:hypothetical protein